MEDEMAGWHVLLSGHKFEQALGVVYRQGNLARCSPWGCKESRSLSDWNWIDNDYSGTCLHNSHDRVSLEKTTEGTVSGVRCIFEFTRYCQDAFPKDCYIILVLASCLCGFPFTTTSDFKISINLMGVKFMGICYFTLAFPLNWARVTNNMENATLSYTMFLTEEKHRRISFQFKSLKTMTS